ncbi:MAG TPA: sugar hydrolase, partial [Clostridia bacterium]|nr:sugar hydrolase [Clostridia bacterium]
MHDKFLSKASELMPELNETIHRPVELVEALPDKNALHGVKMINGKYVENLYSQELQNGDIFTVDFGTHIVGYLTLKIKPVGHQQDSPLRLRLVFGEMPCEIPDFEYAGTL